VPALFRSAIALMRRSRCLPAAGFLLSGPVIFMLGCSIAQAAPGDPSAATLESRKAAGETTTRTCLASGFIQVNFFDKNGKLVSKLQSSTPCTPAKAGSDKATTDSLLASLLVTGDVTGLLGALLESARRELLDLLKNDPELNRLRRLYDNLNVSRSGLLEQIDELEAKKNRLLVYQDLVRGGRIDEQIAREKQKIEALKNNKDIGYLDRTRLLRRYKGNITELEYARNIAGTITNQLNEVSQEIADVERQGEQVLQQMDRAQKAFNDRADAINAEFRRTGGVSAGTSQFAPLRGGPGHASFRIDLDDLRSIAGRLNVSPTADFAPTPQETAPPPWNLWLQGEGTWFEDADAGAERSGAIFTLTAGASYLIDDGVTAGGFLRYKRGSLESNALGSDVDAGFFGGGLFVDVQLPEQFRFGALAAYDRGDSDITIAGATGNFDVDAFSVGGRLSRRYFPGPWWIEPAVSLSYASFERSAYTNSAGTRVAGSTLDQARLKFGPEFGRTFWRPDDDLPRVEVKSHLSGVYDFVSAGDFALAGGAVGSTPEIGVNVGGSVGLLFAGGVKASANFDYIALDGNFSAVSGGARVSIPLN